VTLHFLESNRNVLRTPDFKQTSFEAKGVRCRLNLTYVKGDIGVVGIGKDRKSVKTKDDFAQKFDPLARNIGGLARQPGDVATRSRQTVDHACANRIGCRRKHNWDN